MTNDYTILEFVTRHSSLVTCHSSLVTRHLSLVTCHSSLVTRHSSLLNDSLLYQVVQVDHPYILALAGN